MANIETIALDTRYFAEAAAPATPSAGQVVLYAKTDGLVYAKDDAGTEYQLSAGSPYSAIAEDLVPSADSTYDLGASGTAWAEARADTVYTDAIAEGEGAAGIAINNELKPADAVILTGTQNAQLTANTNDWAPAGILNDSYVRVNTNGSDYNLTGITAGSAGQLLLLLNFDTAQTITLTNEDANSTAANRFELGSDTDFDLLPGGACLLIYDGTTSRWRVIGGSGGGGGAALTVTDESGTVSDTAVTSITVPDGTLVDNGVGDVTLRTVPAGVIGASVHKSADQTNITAGSYVQVTFDTVLFDTDSLFSDANDEFTVPAGMGGKWLVTGSLNVSGASTESRLIGSIHVNDANTHIFTDFRDDAGSGYDGLAGSCSVVLDLAAGDTVDMRVLTIGANTVDVTSGAIYTKLQMIKLGSGTVGEAIGAKAYNNTTQSIPNATVTALTFNSEDFDTDGFHSTSSNTSRMTVPAGLSGTYLVHGKAYAPFAAATSKQIRILKNGTSIASQPKTIGADAAGQEIVQIVKLVAGDYIEMSVYHDQGGAQNYGHASTRATQNELTVILLATQGNTNRAGTPYSSDYTEKTSDTTITATTSPGTTIMTAGAVSCDGSTPVNIEVSIPSVQLTEDGAANRIVNIHLTDGGTDIGRIAQVVSPTATSTMLAVPVHARRRITPSSGSHTYDVRAWKNAAGPTATAKGGAGGVGTFVPAYIRVWKETT